MAWGHRLDGGFIMASGQPANTDIKVFRRVRAQLEPGRHDPVLLQGRIRPRIVIVPSEEVRVTETRDAVISDAWRLGHPLVRYARGSMAVVTAFAGVSGLDFPVRLTNSHRDLLLQKTLEDVEDDLFKDVQDI
jgi:hypothetical protein